MRVKDLQEQLSKFDPELEVLAYTEDESLVVAPGHIFRLMDIEHVSEGEGETLRGRDGIPTMKFGKSDVSTRFVALGVTGTF